MNAPAASGFLDVDGQSIYWEESGTTRGIPALYLHGGPGSGLGKGGYVQRFDPGHYRIIGMDQRGCGRSRPRAGSPSHDLGRNTTQQLIADIELLREHRGIPAWALNGVSWGSTLALAYAQAHPQRVLGIVLMAVTTTGAEEVAWITEGCQSIYPEAWDELATFVERHDPAFRRGRTPMVAAVAGLLQDPDQGIRRRAAVAWGKWEDWHVSIGSGGHRPGGHWDDDEFSLPFATLVTHYWSHHGFLDPPILDRMDQIAHLPGYLIHGRLDVSGPAQTPWLLHRQWPASVLTIVEGEGHGGPRMVRAWTEANARLAERLQVAGTNRAGAPAAHDH